jgi:dCTP diphosphatase
MQPHPQSNESFDALSQLIWRHLEERDWHNGAPRALATSIALEAAELLEHYQWSDQPVGNKEARAEELADILIYAFQYAQSEGIDIAAAIKDKLEKAAKKYPAEQFKGKNSDDMRDAWLQSKQRHRKQGL